MADPSSKLLESNAGVQLMDRLLPMLTKLAPPTEVDTERRRCGDGGEGNSGPGEEEMSSSAITATVVGGVTTNNPPEDNLLVLLA